jgi:hypothetical protein
LYTADIWSDENLCPFFAITAHWIQCHVDGSLVIRADLPAFSYIPGSHSGENIAKAVYAVLEHGELLNNVHTFPMSSSSLLQPNLSIT